MSFQQFLAHDAVFSWFRATCAKSGNLSRQWRDAVAKHCKACNVRSGGDPKSPSLEDICKAVGVSFEPLRKMGRAAVEKKIVEEFKRLESDLQLHFTPGQSASIASGANEVAHGQDLMSSHAKRLRAEADGSTNTSEPAVAAHAPTQSHAIHCRASTPAKRPKLSENDLLESARTPGATQLVPPSTPQSAGRLSDASAQHLARSCRKSPLQSAVDLLTRGDPCSPSSAPVVTCRDYSAEVWAKEKRLLALLPQPVREVYEYVKDHGIRQQEKGEQARSAYQKMYKHVRRRKDSLTAEELELLALQPSILGQHAASLYGTVEECDGGWCWTFAPANVDHCSETFATEQAAEKDLSWLQLDLYPAWADPDARDAHLRRLLQLRQHEPQLISLLAKASLSVVRGPLAKLAGLPCSSAAASDGFSGGDSSQGVDLRHQRLLCGFPNLGNTCFLNAVTQCLLHCRPFRVDLEAQQAGASYLGDRLKSLWNVYNHKKCDRRRYCAASR
jgi:hypothetical protein